MFELLKTLMVYDFFKFLAIMSMGFAFSFFVAAMFGAGGFVSLFLKRHDPWVA